MRIEKGLAFLDRCAVEPDIDKLISEFKEAIALFGFPNSACGSWDGIGEQRVNRFFYTDWPPEVIEAYMANGLITKDPLVFVARRRITPFTWDDAFNDEQLPQDASALYQFAVDHGWNDGFCVPIHGPGSYQGL